MTGTGSDPGPYAELGPLDAARLPEAAALVGAAIAASGGRP
ncbi:hypothetical protein [Micromonospora fulviviridis]|uniref:Uncharacterized protein n=1 Tax=Micromonospora fulviviridis TaxID=47860 RepID=A0ABV2VF71_9ACTN